MMDLTTLEGKDTPGKVARDVREGAPSGPDATRSCRPCAAVCVYPNLVPIATARARADRRVKVASRRDRVPQRAVAARVKLDDVRAAVEFGADEIDMVIDRGAFLVRRLRAGVRRDRRGRRRLAAPAHLKVILETGELGTYDTSARRSGSPSRPAPTSSRPRPARSSLPPRCRSRSCMLEAIRDYTTRRAADRHEARRRRPHREAGPPVPRASSTRLSATRLADARPASASARARSSNDVLMQLEKQRTGQLPGCRLLLDRLMTT